MIARADLIRAVMALEGIKYHHQGRDPEKAGVDCIGVMVVPPRMLGRPLEDYTAYSRTPNPRQLLREIERRPFARVVGEPRFGDAGLCWCHPTSRGVPHHFFWLVPGPDGKARWMMHAMIGTERVCYNPYAEPWPEWTHSFWRWTELEA